MNNIMNSSGIYDINAYNLTTNNATVLSTLNIGGYIAGSGSGLTNLIFDNIIIKPDLATAANLNSLSTNSILSISNLQITSTSLLNETNFSNILVFNASTIHSSFNVSGITTLSNNTNIIGTLNISGNTLLNNFITINSPLYINTNQTTTMSALSGNSTSSSVSVNIVNNAVWNDGVNYALNVSGYSMFGGVQINEQD